MEPKPLEGMKYAGDLCFEFHRRFCELMNEAGPDHLKRMRTESTNPYEAHVQLMGRHFDDFTESDLNLVEKGIQALRIQLILVRRIKVERSMRN